MIFVHSSKMAGWLMLHGNMYKYTTPDNNHKGRVVFVFPDSKEVKETMEKYTKIK